MSTGNGYLCKQCGHTLAKHNRGRCEEGSCPCQLPRKREGDATPVVVRIPERTAQDQRETDLAEVAKRLRAAVVDGHVARAFDIARACWDAGATWRDRQGRKGAP